MYLGQPINTITQLTRTSSVAIISVVPRGSRDESPADLFEVDVETVHFAAVRERWRTMPCDGWRTLSLGAPVSLRHLDGEIRSMIRWLVVVRGEVFHGTAFTFDCNVHSPIARSAFQPPLHSFFDVYLEPSANLSNVSGRQCWNVTYGTLIGLIPLKHRQCPVSSRSRIVPRMDPQFCSSQIRRIVTSQIETKTFQVRSPCTILHWNDVLKLVLKFLQTNQTWHGHSHDSNHIWSDKHIGYIEPIMMWRPHEFNQSWSDIHMNSTNHEVTFIRIQPITR